jgi:hypothetical protein
MSDDVATTTAESWVIEPRALGYDRTITFFNDHDEFVWQKPDELCDVRSGVICSVIGNLPSIGLRPAIFADGSETTDSDFPVAIGRKM